VTPRRRSSRSAGAGQRPSSARDTAVLGELAVDELRLVGPLGFILDKTQWLERYQTGALVTKSLSWDEVEVRDFGDTAIAIGRHTQQADYGGRSADGRFRVTHVFVRSADSAGESRTYSSASWPDRLAEVRRRCARPPSAGSAMTRRPRRFPYATG